MAMLNNQIVVYMFLFIELFSFDSDGLVLYTSYVWTQLTSIWSEVHKLAQFVGTSIRTSFVQSQQMQHIWDTLW